MKNLSQNLSQRIVAYLMLFAFFALPLSAQNHIRVTGVVVDENDEPLPGANVVVVGHNNLGATTNLEGNFTLIRVPKNAMLSISFIGYQNKTAKVSDKPMRIKMSSDSKMLETVVVTALGISREAKSLGYARQSIDTESLLDTRDPNLLNSLNGKVAGVNIISNGGPLSSTRVEIRGNNSLTGNNQPLYVIDGVPIMNEMGESGDLDYGNAASSINPDDIENIEMLKGANAAALYGSDAANGVILITTRKASKKAGLGVSYGYNMQFTFLREYPAYQNVYGSASMIREIMNQGFNFPTSNAMNGYEYNPDWPYGIYSFNWGNTGYSRSWGLPMLGFDVMGRNNVVRSYSPTNDVVKNMYETSIQQTHSVAVDKVFNGASIRFNYTGINYAGMLKNYDEMTRHTFNLRANMSPAKWITADLSLNYQLEDVNNRDYKGSSNRNPMNAIMAMPRDMVMSELTPWKKENGEAFVLGNGFYNPFWLLNELQNADGRNLFRGNLTVNLKPLKHFNIRLRASMERNNKNGWRFDNYSTMWDIDGYYQNFSEKASNYNYEGVISYNNKFFKQLSLNANVGASMQKNSWDKSVQTVNVLAAPDITSIANNASVLTGQQIHTGKQKQSVFGMVSLGYKGMFVDATFRNDWSSTLPKANNSYFYASGSMSAVLTEIFPKIKSKTLAFAKLRGSIARVGNDSGFDQLINGYSYAGLFRNDMAWFSGETLRKNPNLKPETTISKEIGAEVRLLDGRLTADVTYYTKSTHDQIVRTSVSVFSNYQQIVINSGEISNKGWEISLSGSPIQTKNFEWKMLFNWSKNNSMVESLPEGMDKLEIGYGIGNVRSYAEVGKSYGALYAPTYKRDEEGYILCDIYGNPKENPEQIYVGNVQADWRGGFGNTFRWKNLSFSFMLDFQKGGHFLSQTAVNSARDGQSIQSLEGRDAHFFSSKVLGEVDAERAGFMQPGFSNVSSNPYTQVYPDGSRPKGIILTNCRYDSDVPNGWAGQPVMGYARPESYWQHNVLRDMTRFIYDASYIKLREITVSYDFPKKWLRKTPFQAVRVSGVGRNIATLFCNTPQGLDPQATSTTGNAQGFEYGFNLPSATYGFDVKISF